MRYKYYSSRRNLPYYTLGNHPGPTEVLRVHVLPDKQVIQFWYESGYAERRTGHPTATMPENFTLAPLITLSVIVNNGCIKHWRHNIPGTFAAVQAAYNEYVKLEENNHE